MTFKPYLVAFGHDVYLPEPALDFYAVGYFATLEEARKARCVSGDLVFDTRTRSVVESDEWLWDWEKAKDDCYARRCIRNRVKLNWQRF